MLQPFGPDWVGFQKLRVTNASLGKEADADVEVMSDLRRHGLGVAMEVYTRSSIQQKATELKKLETAVLKKVVSIRKTG